MGRMYLDPVQENRIEFGIVFLCSLSMVLSVVFLLLWRGKCSELERVRDELGERVEYCSHSITEYSNRVQRQEEKIVRQQTELAEYHRRFGELEGRG